MHEPFSICFPVLSKVSTLLGIDVNILTLNLYNITQTITCSSDDEQKGSMKQKIDSRAYSQFI